MANNEATEKEVFPLAQAEQEGPEPFCLFEDPITEIFKGTGVANN